MIDLHPDLTRVIRRRLLAWYRRHRRDLPWRRTRNPYRIWVAETMLQQTQVARVETFYRRFIGTFPSMRSLARASLDEVLTVWAGMGYYGRARHLHAAAQIIVDEHRGRLPRTVQALRELPGVGRYTAGAVASVAFGVPAPVVDGNVARVLCRLFAIQQQPREAATQRDLWDLAQALVSRRAPGNFNQAMMELGATVCVPRVPRCPRCPLEGHCQARRHGLERRVPLAAPRKTVPHHHVVIGIIQRGRRVLVDKRPPRGLLGGLWEFPGGKRKAGETDAPALRRELKEELGIDVVVGRRLATVGHAYSHFRVTLHVYACRLKQGRPKPIGCDAVRWATPADIDRLPLPAGTRRILERIRRHLGGE